MARTTHLFGRAVATRVDSTERGQVLIMFVLFLPILLGMVAMALDLGSYASERTTLQSAADSIALAAARELPSESATLAAADTWAIKSGVDPAEMTVTVTGTSGNAIPRVTVAIERDHPFVFAKIFGVESADVGARAAVTKSSYGGGGLIVPWGIPQVTVDAAANGGLITMKYDSNGVVTGNFGAIRLDGSDSDYYEQAIKYGSTSEICSVHTPGCDKNDCPGSSCAETSPECDGSACRPKTGNMTGPTRNGVDYRMDNTGAACDTFAEAFTLSGGSYQLNPACNPFSGSGSTSKRVIIIPVIDQFGNGSSDDVNIQSFALMYLEGYENGKCQGNSCEIKGRFIKNAVTIPGLTGSGAYDPSTSIQFTRLAE